MKFAIWVLVIAAILSLIALLAGELLPPQILDSKLAQFLDLNDPFRSWWFNFLLTVLSISLLACIIVRTPILFNQAFRYKFRWDTGQFENQNIYHSFASDNAEQDVEAILKENGFSSKKNSSDDKVAYSAKRGGLSRLGPLLTHSGILLLILGGLVSGLTGVTRTVSGSAGDVLMLPDWGFKLRIEDFKIEYYPVSVNQWVEAPNGQRGKVVAIEDNIATVNFHSHGDVAVTDTFPVDSLNTGFLISRNGRTSVYQGNIKSYITDATIMVDSVEIKQQAVKVNHPLRYRGYRFYQSSFEMGSHKTQVDSVVISVKKENEIDTSLVIKISDTYEKLTEDLSVKALRFFPDFKLDGEMNAYSASGMLINPAVEVEVKNAEGSEKRQWVFARDLGMMGHAAEGLKFLLVDLRGVSSTPGSFTTILTVSKSFGSVLIWAGFILGTLGMLLVYGITYSSLWLLIEPLEGKKSKVHLTGFCQHDEVGLRDRLKESLRKFTQSS